MSGIKKAFSLPHFVIPLVIICTLVLTVLACSITTTPTEAPLAPTMLVPATLVPEAITTQPAVPPAESAPSVNLGADIIGFWRSKVVSKEVMVFEFQGNGLTVWHYRYNNGEVKDKNGTFTVQDNKVVVNFGEPQELTALLEGAKLTLTGPDGKPLDFQRVTSLDDPGPSASKNVSQDIINRWQDSAVGEWIEFKADGKVTIQTTGGDLNGTYSISGNRMEMKLDNQEKSSSFTVEIDSNVLTLIAEDGSFTDYVR